MTGITPDPKWSRPRQTIALKYKKNDFGYVTHGSLAAVQVLKMFDEPPSTFTNLTVLDYGCGTGREARLLSAMFKQVHAYDPTPNCIQEFRKEIQLCERDFPNILLYTDINKVPVCDYGYSLHVMEHLTDEQAQLMMDALRARVKSRLMLSYAKRNTEIVAPYLTPEQREDDLKRNEDANQNSHRGVRWRLIDFRK